MGYVRNKQKFDFDEPSEIPKADYGIVSWLLSAVKGEFQFVNRYRQKASDGLDAVENKTRNIPVYEAIQIIVLL
jgi:hypothetical protein